MADAIIGAVSKKWPLKVQDFVTPELVLKCLESGEAVADNGPSLPSAGGTAAAPTAAGRKLHQLRLTSTRPAMVAFILDMMGTANVGAPEVIFKAAMQEMHDKILRESGKDTALALQTIIQPMRKLLFRLAEGRLTYDELEAELTDLNRGTMSGLLATLCEEPGRDKYPKLLPPYGVLFANTMNKDGTLLAEWQQD